ncbi:hydrolase [Phyllobacterium phragmitis]|uniref:Hydrolase n=1 Tax=Phyllobacterium phragmitis TaxID=2670329 RepID=A0A2S9ITF5_9HYPH|nr:HAD family hydrolase [Phyllobacterium phragmitis]PRD43805.1 hydrolase [Phyllobacterium phragmitis]
MRDVKAIDPGLVIFDCDGVLVDSEPLAIRVLIETLADAGLTMDAEEAYERFLGRSLGTITAILSEEFQVDLTHAALENGRARLYEVFHAELKPVAGIADTLDRLDVPFCVASSSQPERIRLSLSVTGLLDRFEPNIFSATMVEKGKPAPDLFLHAAGMMNVPPQDCLVIEDSPAGVQAAKAAGMDVFAFVGGGHAGGKSHRDTLRLLAPDCMFDEMARLPDMLHSSLRA